MGWVALLALAVALAMDAFAVAMATSFSLADITHRHLFRLSFHFGLFQAAMLLVGWLCGDVAFTGLAGSDHWIAFGLLLFVGGRMIWSAIRGEARQELPDRTRGWDLVLLSVATSIDALAVGLSLALLGTRVILPALVVGLVAAALTIVGMLLGRRIALHWGRSVEVAGGLVLIAIGLKIVVEHLPA